MVRANPIFRKNREQAALEVSEYLKDSDADILVVGIPKGSESEEEMGRRIKHFVSLIEFNGKIEFVDESFSSFEAKERLKGKKKEEKDGSLDTLSAMIILERFLEQNRDL